MTFHFSTGYDGAHLLTYFGTPSKSNQPSGAKTLKITIRICSKNAFLKQPCVRDVACAPGHIFHDVCTIFRPFNHHFERFSKTFAIVCCMDFQYYVKPPDTRNNAEHLQRTCKKLRNERTSKKLADTRQRTSKKLPRNANNLHRTSKKPAKLNLRITNAYCILQHNSNHNGGRAS